MLHVYVQESVFVLVHSSDEPSIFGSKSILQSWASAGAQIMATTKAASASMAVYGVRRETMGLALRVYAVRTDDRNEC